MDVFYTSSPESDGSTAAATSGSDVSVLAPVAGAAITTAERRPADAGEWRAWLERSGFSPEEAGRLVFERLRPREEGTARI